MPTRKKMLLHWVKGLCKTQSSGLHCDKHLFLRGKRSGKGKKCWSGVSPEHFMPQFSFQTINHCFGSNFPLIIGPFQASTVKLGALRSSWWAAKEELWRERTDCGSWDKVLFFFSLFPLALLDLFPKLALFLRAEGCAVSEGWVVRGHWRWDGAAWQQDSPYSGAL